VEIIFPTWLLLQCFARFAEERPQTRIELYESVPSGTEEALLQRKAAGLGLGFAWFPEETVRDELEHGVLKPLPLREGGERWGNLYLVFADEVVAGSSPTTSVPACRAKIQSRAAAGWRPRVWALSGLRSALPARRAYPRCHRSA
jgi:DNA-binding transcriptional LysR family regulator